MSELPDNAISTTRLLPSTQTEIDIFSDQLIESVKSGHVYGLELLKIFRSLEKVQDRVLKEIKQNILAEAEAYPERSFDFQGVKMEKAETGVSYDYSVCGDPVHDQRESIMNAAKSLLDERKEFLKALKEPVTIVDEGSGEVVTIRPPSKKSTSSIKVSIR